jgi:phospholipid/cholesterol/gamma-HCH transport system permease protein
MLGSLSMDTQGRVRLEHAGDELRVCLSGDWTLRDGLPALTGIAEALEAGSTSSLVFDTTGLGVWDSALVTFLHGVHRIALARDIRVDLSGLPDGPRRLLTLAAARPPRELNHTEEDSRLGSRVGRTTFQAWDTLADAVGFLGETTQAFVAMVRGRARYRAVDLMLAFQSAGIEALGIVALINFLIGGVLAFVGVVQLGQFGAALYVADLVAIGVCRELGALMTGIVIAGRTGASYAAVLGTMTVNEEVDALGTMGLRPVEFLVLPRVVASALMMPALVAFADLLGVLGGLFVGVAVLDLGAVEYLNRTQETLALRHVVIGLVKGFAFGGIVALIGCYYGLRCGRSAAAVGVATTKAVVNTIVMLVVVDSIFTVLLHVARL